MEKLPEPVPLILCQKINVAVETGYSLVGLFQSRRFRAFPTAAQSFWVYVALRGGRGEGTMTLEIMFAETEEFLFSRQKWVSFSDPDLVYNIEIPVRNCHFPSPGRYLCTLRFQDEILAHRILDLSKEVSSP
jgi:hypothetical protein